MKKRTTLLWLLCVLVGTLGARPMRVACVGDSITYGLRIIGRQSNSYPAVLQELLGGEYEVGNFGANSATAQDDGNRPYTAKSVFKKSIEWEPDIVVILFGTNDSKKQNWKGVDAYMDAMWHIASLYAGLPTKPAIYLMTPPKAFSDYLGINDQYIEMEANALLSQSTLPVIDIRASFKLRRDWIVSDGIHPNNEGARIIAQMVAKRVSDEGTRR